MSRRPPCRWVRAERGHQGICGLEVDILADGTLDLSDEALAQMDIVIASVRSHFKQEPAEMTDRLLRAIANPHVSLIGHPTGRILLRRVGYGFDMETVLKAAAQCRVAMELAYPDRLDLCDRHLRMAREHGVKTVIETDILHNPPGKTEIVHPAGAAGSKRRILNSLAVEAFAKAFRRA